MNPKQLAAFLAFFAAGAATSMTTAALIREAPGNKSYYTRHLEIDQRPAADGGNDISATAWVNVTLALTDGGADVADLGGVPCDDLIASMSPASRTCLQTVLTGSANCGKTAK